jgi:predicted nuclease of predicted toxin-antitoxin system
MRFLIDMPLSPAVAAWLRDRGPDALHASEIGLSASPDTEIVARARDEGRVIVTADLDYPRLLALAGARSPGVLLFRGGNFSEQECLARL